MKTMQGPWLRPAEQIADARGADAHEHLDELGSAQAEERDVRFARHRPRQQRLAGAGGPTSSTPFGIRPPRFVYFFGLRRNRRSPSAPLRFVDARDVGEAHLHLVVGIDLGAGCGRTT